MAKHYDRFGNSIDYRIRGIGVPSPRRWDLMIAPKRCPRWVRRLVVGIDRTLVRGRYEAADDGLARR